MAFGFGFNKAKVLASAEKNVKAGKLTQALADYEKILRHEPDDMSALNTAGDLYASTGDALRATGCFRRVAAAYVSAGFAVKAIAIYKKLLRHNPAATNALVQMAELYAGQRQPNDARVHYLQAASQFAANKDLAGASHVLQKALELDTDNAQVLERLRDVLPQLGKEAELRDLYLRAAQNHRRRKQSASCQQMLEQALKLDPKYSPALLLAAELNLESGDPQTAVRQLRSMTDLNTHAEALRLLVRALLQAGDSAAEVAAVQLLTTYRDWTGLASLAEWSARRADYRPLVAICERHGAELLAAGSAHFAEFLDLLGNELRDDPEALESVASLLEKTGDSTLLGRGLERLAAARERAGDAASACQVYERLAALEPEDPAHREQLRRLREREQAAKIEAHPESAPAADDAAADEAADDAGSRWEEQRDAHESPPAAERDDLLIEEGAFQPPASEADAAAAEQSAVGAALTDADLYAAYRLHDKAIQTLEAVLPQAPRDLRIQRQLADLYTQVGRIADAARCYSLLADLCAEQGHENGVVYYRQCATHCLQQVQETLPPPGPTLVSSPVVAPPAPVEEAAPEDASRDEDEVEDDEEDGEAAGDININEADAYGFAAVAQPMFAPVDSAVGFEELLDEAEFYLGQAMLEETGSALARAEELVPDSPAVEALWQRLEQLQDMIPAPGGNEAEASLPEGPSQVGEFSLIAEPEAVQSAAEPEAVRASPPGITVPTLAVDPPAIALEVEIPAEAPAPVHAPEVLPPAPAGTAEAELFPSAVDVALLPAKEPETQLIVDPAEVPTPADPVIASEEDASDDLFEIGAQQTASLEGPLLPIESVLASPAAPAVDEQEGGEELLTDATASAPLEPRAALIPLEHAEEYSDWPVEEIAPEPAAPEAASENDPFGDFEALFIPPAPTTSAPGRARRRRP